MCPSRRQLTQASPAAFRVSQRSAPSQLVQPGLVERALRMEGTCSGEHGMGVAKKKWATEEFGPGALAAMRTVKQAFDPLNILNPGKIFDL